jgi:hypothetical protein
MRLGFAVVLAVLLLAPRAASAEPAPGTRPAVHRREKQKAERKGVSPEKLRHEMEGQIAKLRDKLEQSLQKRKLPADRAQSMRDSFNAGVLEARRRFGKAVADGVVTREEARDVKDGVRSIRARERKPKK